MSVFKLAVIPFAKYCEKQKTKRRVKVSRKYWESIKGIYAGKRGFVIGNGPSLSINQLNQIKSEISIASNKVYLAFAQTEWRPSYYTLSDVILWNKIKDKLLEHVDCIHIPSYLEAVPLALKEKCFTWRSLSRRRHPEFGEFYFSADLTQGAFSGGTVTYDNLQFAMHLGLNPIYIIGCDHHYAGEESVVGHSQLIEAPNIKNHFIEGYRQPGEIVPSADITLMSESYELARRFAEKRDIDIYNATPGGHLEVYERVSFESLFKS